MSHRESEEALQKRLDEVSRELCRLQTSHASLRADAEKVQEQQKQMAGEGGIVGPWGLGRKRICTSPAQGLELITWAHLVGI